MAAAALDPRATQAVVLRMERFPPELERALVGELEALAQIAARYMRNAVPKWRSQLVNSVHVAEGPLERRVGPATDYAEAADQGVKPGGKGLPRFHDPAAADIIAWLKTKAFAGRSAPRKGSMAAVRANLELRDRYEGLAWHIRHKGVKGTPFMEPTLRFIEPKVLPRLQAAGEAALKAAGTGAGGAA
jgi:hypothetical protein